MSLKDRILSKVTSEPGLTDRELTDVLLGEAAGQQAVNQAAHALASRGAIERGTRPDGKIGNYPTGSGMPPVPARSTVSQTNATDGMTEDMVKAAVAEWLEGQGWTVQVRWGYERGIDIEASRDNERWVIEAKGCGSRQPMRVNYFIAMLGETLQRMDDDGARYSIALPDMAQYRGLWERLPDWPRTGPP